MELFKDYYMSVFYHPNKVDVVANALSHLSMGSISYVDEAKRNLLKDVYRLDILGMRLEDSLNGGSWSTITPSHLL